MFNWSYEKLFDFSVWLGKIAFKYLVKDENKRREILKKANELHEKAGEWLKALGEDPQAWRKL